MQKRNDYSRHKLLRKIKRQRRAQVEQQKVAAEKELKRRLRVTPPKFGDGKDPIDTSKIDELSYVYAPPRIDEYGNTVVYANDPLGVEGDGISSPLQLRRPVTYGTQLLDEVVVPGSKYAKEAGKQNFNLTKGEAMQMEDFDKLQNLMHKSTFGKRLSNDKDAILVDPQTAYDAFHDYTIASELKHNLSTPSRYNMATLADMSSGERVNMVGLGIPAAINTAAMFGGGIPGMLASGFASMAGMPSYMPSQVLNHVTGGGVANNQKFWLTGNSGDYLIGQYPDMAFDMLVGGGWNNGAKRISDNLIQRSTGAAIGTATMAGMNAATDTYFRVVPGDLSQENLQRQQYSTAAGLLGGALVGNALNGNVGPKRFRAFGKTFKNPLFSRYSTAYKEQLERMNALWRENRDASEKRYNEAQEEVQKAKQDLSDATRQLYAYPKTPFTGTGDIRDEFKVTPSDELIEKATQRKIRKAEAYRSPMSDARERTFKQSDIHRFRTAEIQRQLDDVGEKFADQENTNVFVNPITGKTAKETIRYGKSASFRTGDNGSMSIEADLKHTSTKRSQQKEVAQEIDSYVSDLEKSVLDGDGIPNGVVSGSLLLKASDYMAGLPHDTEMITTEGRLAELKRQLGATPVGSNGIAEQLISDKFWNSDGNHMGDVQIIKEKNGRATGKLALQLYRAIDPKGFNRLAKQYQTIAENGGDPNVTNTTNWEIPMSAEQLYRALVDRGVRTKVVVNDNLVRTKKAPVGGNKGNERTVDALTYPDQKEIISSVINDVYTANGFESPLKEFANLDLNDVSANEEFLLKLGWDPSDLGVAKNPQMMRNVIDAYLLANHVRRTVSNSMLPDVLKIDNPYVGYKTATHQGIEDALTTNVAPTNGQGSGIGGNTVASPYEHTVALGGDYTGALQPIWTSRRGEIRKPIDVWNATQTTQDRINSIGSNEATKTKAIQVLENISSNETGNTDFINHMINGIKSGHSLYDIFDEINRSVAMKNLSIEEGVKYTEMLADAFDIGVYKNERSIYGPHYRGMLRKPKLGNVIQTVNQDSDYGLKIEMGDEPRFKSSHKTVSARDLPKPYSETIQRLENDFYGYKKEASQGYPYRVYDESLKGVSAYRIQDIFSGDMTTYYRLKDKLSSETQSQCSKVEKIQNDIAERGSITESQYLQYRRELRKLYQMIEKDIRIDDILSSDAGKTRAEMAAAKQMHGLKKSKLKRDVERLGDERVKRQIRENAMYRLYYDKYTLYPDFYKRQVSKPDRTPEAILSTLVGFGAAPLIGAFATDLSTSEKTQDEFFEKLNKPKIWPYKKSEHKSLRQKK